MSNEPKRTSFMRYSRVNEILRSDNALSRRLSKKTVAVCRPDQTHQEFPVEVVFVTDEIHKQGTDAYTMPKMDVIRTAHRLLVANSQPIPHITPPPAPKVKAKPPQKKAAAKTKVPPKAKVLSKAKAPPAKPKPKPQPKARRRAPAPKDAATVERPPTVEPAKAGSNTEHREPPTIPVAVALPKLPPEFVRPYVHNVVGVAALSNLQAVLTLFEPYVANGDTDAKEVCQKVNELIDEIHRRTVLPTSVEKEPTTAAG